MKKVTFTVSPYALFDVLMAMEDNDDYTYDITVTKVDDDLVITASRYKVVSSNQTQVF